MTDGQDLTPELAAALTAFLAQHRHDVLLAASEQMRILARAKGAGTAGLGLLAAAQTLAAWANEDTP